MSTVSRHMILLSLVQYLGQLTDGTILYDYFTPKTCKDSCGYIDEHLSGNTVKFLDTAPCPPLSNLPLICQHSYKLNCSEVAAILDRCIYKYGVDCDMVFLSLESCVCDFNMTCSAINDTYVNNCGWKDKDFYCNTKSSISVVTVPQTVPTKIVTIPDIDNSSTESHITDLSTSNRLIPTIVEETTPFIGGSQSHQKSICDVTCILIASLGGTTVCLITALVLYKCYRRWQLRSKQDDSSPVSTLGYVDPKSQLQDTKDSLSISGSSIEKKKKGRQLIGPSFCDNHMGGIKLGRPCSGFYTHMIDRRSYENFPSVDTSTGHLVWEGGFSQAIPLQTLAIDSDISPRSLPISRPSLSTFRYEIPGNTHNIYNDFLGYNNPVYSESTQ